MFRRKEAKFACDHKSSDLPTGQPASFQILGRAYYAHNCKACTAEDCRRSVDETHSNYHAERLRLLRAKRASKTLLESDTTTDRELHEREIQRIDGELKYLDTTEDMACRAIWTTYHTLWPTIHELPSTS